MKKTVTILISICSFLISSCDSKSSINENDIFFSRSDFEQVVLLKNADTINLEDALNPLFFYVLRDSLILVQNKDDSQLFKAGIYSLRTGKIIKEIAPKGLGPKEFVSCQILPKPNDNNVFYLDDVAQNKYSILDVDSVLSNDQYCPKSFTYPRSLIHLDIIDSTRYVGYNYWHLEHPKFNNNVQALDYYKISSSVEQKNLSNMKYFVANVTGGHTFYESKNKQIWVANFYDDRLNIYNDSLKLLKTLSGPDHFERKFATFEEEKMESIYFEKGCSYMAYKSFCVVNNHIYLVYDGTHGVPFRTNNLNSIEVFKLDLSGNLLTLYKLDRYIYSISVDSNEEYIYGTSCHSFEETPQLIKYKI